MFADPYQEHVLSEALIMVNGHSWTESYLKDWSFDTSFTVFFPVITSLMFVHHLWLVQSD